MGCVCCSVSSFVSILLDALERVSLCTVCAMLTCCLLITILMVIVLGIGIGYHYCLVQGGVKAMEKAAKSMQDSELRSGTQSGAQGQVLRSVDKSARGFAHRISRRDAAELQTTNSTQNFQMSDRNTFFNPFERSLNYARRNVTSVRL